MEAAVEAGVEEEALAVEEAELWRRQQPIQASNYTSIIQTKSMLLSPDINYSIAVISQAGYHSNGNVNRSVTIYGVDFNQYQQLYPTTFVAASGTIPQIQADNDIVVGTRLIDPRQNGTILFNAGDNVKSRMDQCNHFTYSQRNLSPQMFQVFFRKSAALASVDLQTQTFTFQLIKQKASLEQTNAT